MANFNQPIMNYDGLKEKLARRLYEKYGTIRLWPTPSQPRPAQVPAMLCPYSAEQLHYTARCFALSKINLREPFALICQYQTPTACTEHRAERYLSEFYQNPNLAKDPEHVSAAIEISQTLGSCEEKIHFREMIFPYTDRSLGDCPYLDQCYHINKGCRYMHYTYMPPRNGLGIIGVEMLKQTKRWKSNPNGFDMLSTAVKMKNIEMLEKCQAVWRKYGPILPAHPVGQELKPVDPQWINCDIRKLDFRILGKFSVIMADPPWPIHMSLPYGALADAEIFSLPINVLSDHGFMFLWVTTRYINAGRECLRHWGYRVSNELVWVKTNQLSKTIVSGITGHWLNHTKEHCLVGIKGNPPAFSKEPDTIVAPMRETSRKPDEIYAIIDRLTRPNVRKLELFGRRGNLRKGWLTVGNQVPAGFNVGAPGLAERLNPQRIGV